MSGGPADGAALRVPAETVRELLAVLNALSLNEVSRVQGDLERVRAALGGLGQDDLADRIAQAQSCLRTGSIKEFRKAIANVTARLGHLR